LKERSLLKVEPDGKMYAKWMLGSLPLIIHGYEEYVDCEETY
jgi:hypothetical protein